MSESHNFPTPFMFEDLQHELGDAAHALNDLLNQYKMHTANHPDDDLRILTIGIMESRVNRYRQRAGLEPIEYD